MWRYPSSIVDSLTAIDGVDDLAGELHPSFALKIDGGARLDGLDLGDDGLRHPAVQRVKIGAAFDRFGDGRHRPSGIG